MTTSCPRPALRDLGSFPTPLAIDRSSTEPLHRQIYVWYRSAISDGRLRPGQALPSTRGLSEELGVSRAPVLSAFEQLTAEGYLDAVVGSGTRVSSNLDATAGSPSAPELAHNGAGLAARRVSRRAAGLVLPEEPWLTHPGAFRASMPALDRFPSTTWATLMARHSRARSAQLLGYGDPMGHPPLRQAVAQYLGAARGVRCTSEQVMIVSGSQQGLYLTARALLDVGECVLLEEPGYPGARAASRPRGSPWPPCRSTPRACW